MSTKLKSRRKDTKRPSQGRTSEPVPLIYGLHAVEAALANPKRQISQIVATENAARKLAGPLKIRGLPVEIVQTRHFERILPADTVHQGVCITVAPLDEPSLDDLAERATSGRPIVVLDQVTDPHNVGAVLRSATVFGTSGLVMTRRHSPPLHGTLAKSASGALELIPVALVQNLAKALAELKASGVNVIGLAGDAPHAIEAEQFDMPVALVFGAEGKGLREKTTETCDRLVRISARGPLASLNVSNAAAVALHVVAQRQKA